MKQEKFIELLNLYVDGELSSAEAAELEHEITRDPDRHKIYRQYCQMQRACTLLSERFRDDAAPAAIFRGGEVVAVLPSRRGNWLRPVAWAASGALAACFAFVVIQTQFAPRSPAVASAPAAQPRSAALAANSALPATTRVTPVAMSRPVLFRDPWSPTPSVPVRMAGWQPLQLDERNLTLVVPPLAELGGPSGSATDDEAADLRVEEIEAAAFQFQK